MKMKKPYIKPIITFERLDVSNNIATGCAFISTNLAQYVCPAVDEESGWTIFSDNRICKMVPGAGDTICYDIPFANMNIFES